MANRFCLVLLVIATVLIPAVGVGHAQVFVDSTNGTSTVAFNGTTQKYSVTLTATGASPSFYVYAEPQSGIVPKIANIDVATGGYSVNLYIGEKSTGEIRPPASLDNLDFTGTGSVRLQRGRIDGDLGEEGELHLLRVSEIVDILRVEGDTWAEIEVTPGPFDFGGVNEIVIGENLYSGIRVSSANFMSTSIKTIEVQGSAIGSIGFPAYVESDSTILEIRILGDANQFAVRPSSVGGSSRL